MSELSAEKQIDNIIKMHPGWKAETLSQIRKLIKKTDPEIVEQVKWKMANRPQGLPVWYHNSIICFAETWKDNIKLIFSKGAHLKDTNKLFNSRLNSKDLRAIEFKEDHNFNFGKLDKLLIEAINFNRSKSKL